MRSQIAVMLVSMALVADLAAAAEPATSDWSRRPMRPLPAASARPLATGPARFVDARQGADKNDGSQAKPWRTLQHAVNQLKPGDTLYLRAGNYDEHVTMTASGTRDKPITLRSYPGELAVIDGCLTEFRDAPAQAWEQCPDGVEGEFRSTKAYPHLGGKEGDPNLLGSFAESMVPLEGYRFHRDLQSSNPYWNVDGKTLDKDAVYCGPGVFYDVATGRIHARLAHTQLPGLEDDNYRGPTDPRQVSLVIGAHAGGSPLTLDGVSHVRLQDLVVRGARESTLQIIDGYDIELDGLTLYGGADALKTLDTVGLRVYHSALRGISAPWTFRGGLKYRSIEARIVRTGGWNPSGAESSDFEFAYCEFTDSVDGVFVGNVHRVRFHHNLLENLSDDGIFLTSNTGFDGVTPGGDMQFYQNRFARCLTTFAFGVGHGRQKLTVDGRQTGAGAWIMRNVFDFRQPVHYYWPTGPDAPQEIASRGRFGGDHGSPAWEPMWIYHNTLLTGDPPRYDYLTDGWGRGIPAGTERHIMNNIVCQLKGLPGGTLPSSKARFSADGNVLWSVSDGPAFQGDVFAKFRASPEFAASKSQYAPGWTVHDKFADPKFVAYDADWQKPVDLRLADGSPAIDAGVAIDPSWPDPLRSMDAGAPDAGAIVRGSQGWPIGVHGRYSVFGGEPAPSATMPRPTPAFPELAEPPKRTKRALVVQGYPAFDAPLIEFVLRKSGARVDVLEQTWFDTTRLNDYDLVAYDGSFVRAKIEPHQFSADDLPRVQQFLNNGGTLLLTRERADLFGSAEGRAFLDGITGNPIRERQPELLLQLPKHDWVKHLASGPTRAWFTGRQPIALATNRGEVIIGSSKGMATLCRVPVGKGQLIYVGWSIASYLPDGRRPVTVEQETEFAEQLQILQSLVADAVGR